MAGEAGTMRDKIIAKRYAEAFVDYARPRIGLQRCVDEIKAFKWLLRENPELSQFIRSPEVPHLEKYAVLERALAASYSDESVTFVKYLIEKGRFDHFALIADHIREHYSHGEGMEAVLRTTFPLGLDLVEKIKAMLEARFEKKVNLYMELDPTLLGGVQIVAGNKIIDGSVKHKLEGLRKQLMKTQVTG
jgi:F-type H+-transporting ATPase subunit delta